MLHFGVLLSGCAAVDHYAPRAIDYNIEADDARSSLVLMNILRAAYRLPLQFSEVSSVTGIASASGTLSSTVPVIGTGALLSPQATISGGPNFAFSNLSTQEFYQASSTEIDNATIALMLNQGFSPQVVFPLVVSDIYVTDGPVVKRIRMDVDNRDQFRTSFTAINLLVRQGLTAKQVTADTDIGPPLDEQQARIAAFNILRGTDVSKEPSLTRTRAGAYKLSTSERRVVLCFDPTIMMEAERRENAENGKIDDSNIFVATVTRDKTFPLAIRKSRADRAFSITLPASYRCGSEPAGEEGRGARRGAAGKDMDITFRTRSLQGMYEYVGSLARIELGLDAPPASLALETPTRDFYLFNIRAGLPSPGDIGAGSQPFFITPDPAGKDLSSQVLKALVFLQALNSKATTLPAPVTTSILVR